VEEAAAATINNGTHVPAEHSVTVSCRRIGDAQIRLDIDNRYACLL
jgi:hypothetical protein